MFLMNLFRIFLNLKNPIGNPDMDNENWQAWINIFKGENVEMRLEKQAFGSLAKG